MRISICSWLQTSLSPKVFDKVRSKFYWVDLENGKQWCQRRKTGQIWPIFLVFFTLHIFLYSNQWEQAYMVGLICYGYKKHYTVTKFHVSMYYVHNVWIRQNLFLANFSHLATCATAARVGAPTPQEDDWKIWIYSRTKAHLRAYQPTSSF